MKKLDILSFLEKNVIQHSIIKKSFVNDKMNFNSKIIFFIENNSIKQKLDYLLKPFSSKKTYDCIGTN
jgi:hypothetical protein